MSKKVEFLRSANVGNEHYDYGSIVLLSDAVADGLMGEGYAKEIFSPISSIELLTGAVVGVGTLKPVESSKSYVFEVWGTATAFTLHIEVVGPSGVAKTINKVWDELNNGYLSGKDITAAGFYSVSVPAFTSIRGNVTIITGGNVNVKGGLL